MFKKNILAMAVAAQLTACATATRGSTTLLVVNTSPSGAKVITSSETKQSTRLSKTARQAALDNGTVAELGIEYRGCDPTPCGIEVPRKAQFEILVSKDGYISQVQFIDKIHRKDVVRKNAAKTVGGATVAAGGTAAVAGITGASVLGTSLVAPVAILAAGPVLTIGGISLAVDSATGANYDLTPNPVDMVLHIPQGTSQDNEDLIAKDFYQRRRDKSLNINQPLPEAKPVKMCYVSERTRIPCEIVR